MGSSFGRSEGQAHSPYDAPAGTRCALLLVVGAAGNEFLDLIVGDLVVILISVLLNRAISSSSLPAVMCVSSCVPGARQSSALMFASCS